MQARTIECNLVTSLKTTTSHSQGRKGSVMYKSQLQEYAQKAAIPPPVYEFVKEGASHEPRFKAIVILNNVTYESPPGFPNLKSAEHAAAKAALDGLLQSTGGTGVAPSPVHESGLCKNLLQEYAQKNSLPLPVYQSQRSGEDHAPTFTSSVEIAGVKYSGGSAKNKKEAEIKAARTALLAIQSAQSSAPVAVPEPLVAPAPVAHLGLATLISTHLNNTPGKKRGRGVAYATVDEPSAGRLKTNPQVAQAPPEVHVKSSTPTAPPEMIETTMNLATPGVSEVQQLPTTSSVKSSVDIADLLATPGARKILGKTSKLPQTENSYLLQGTSLFSSPMQGTALFSSPSASPSSKSATAGTTHFSPPSISPSPTVTANSNLGVQGKSNITKNGVAEEVGSGNQTAVEEVQVNLVSGASEIKEDQSLIQTTQSSGLISLTG